jgi:hypothetical protein
MRKKRNWDEHLFIVLFSYMTSYKVAMGYTPYMLIYGLHPLLPTKYVLSAINGDHKDAKPTKVLIAKVIELQKLQENKLESQNDVRANNGTNLCGVNKKT